MLKSEARTAIRAATAHDSDTQVTDAQLNAWIDLEYPRVRRDIFAFAPGLYSDTSSTQALTEADPDFDPPADFERVIRFERLDGSDYIAVPVADPLHPDLTRGGRGYREEDAKLRVFPARNAAGTYRLVYSKAPTLTGDYTIEVPTGCEEIIVERVSAKVRVRLSEDPTPHLQEAARIWAEQRTAIRRRYGAHAESGFANTEDEY